MDYKKTASYRIGVVLAVVGVLLLLAQLLVDDLGAGFLNRPGVASCFLLVGVVLGIAARRRAEKQETVGQDESGP